MGKRRNKKKKKTDKNTMPTRSSTTRRSLESNRQERQVAFSSARSMFEAQRAEQQGQREVRERGDEEYGPIVYKSSMYMDDENEQSQGIEGIHFFFNHTLVRN